jgi:hypothetical protein
MITFLYGALQCSNSLKTVHQLLKDEVLFHLAGSGRWDGRRQDGVTLEIKNYRHIPYLALNVSPHLDGIAITKRRNVF